MYYMPNMPNYLIPNIPKKSGHLWGVVIIIGIFLLLVVSIVLGIFFI